MGHYQEGDGVQECEHRSQFQRRHQKDFDSEGTGTVSLAWMKCVQNIEEQRVVVSVPKIWKRIGEETQRIRKVRRCPTLIEVLGTADSGAECRSAKNHPLSRAFAATQWSTVYQTLHWSLKDSGNRTKNAERSTKGTVSNACKKAPTLRRITSS